MSTGSANTSYLDHDSVCTGAMMPEDWLVVPEHGRGINGTCNYTTMIGPNQLSLFHEVLLECPMYLPGQQMVIWSMADLLGTLETRLSKI